MTTTRFCIIRHGETDWNRERRLQGHTDIPLNGQGHQQARQLQQALAQTGLTFDALHVSDLTRTQQTAAPLAELYQLTPHYHAELRERHYGQYQGLTYAEIQQQWPQHYPRIESRDPDYDMEGGESLNHFRQRIISCFSRLAQSHPAQTLLVVTHGGVLEILHRTASGTPLNTPRNFPIPNAALNWVTYNEGVWMLEKWADESHLQAALDEL